FTLATSCLTGVVFGLIPALRTSNPSLAPTLKSEATNLSGGNTHARVRKSLVVVQVTLSLLLVIGAGLFARSLYNLRVLDPGFQPDHLLQFSVDPALNGYSDPREVDFFLQLQERFSHVPGVKSISAAEAGFLSGMDATYTVQIEDRKNTNPNEALNPHANFVGPRFFATLGIPVIVGREFTESDKAGAPRVCLINDKFRQMWFRDQNPVGRHIWFNSHPERTMEIVGVVKDTKSISLRDQVEPFFYVPLMQDNNIGQLNFVVRTTQDPNALSALVRRQIQEIDNTLPIFYVQTMEAQVDRSIYVERMVAMLSVFFAALAALLAAVGLYGVMAFTVARRTSEIGVRLALGASRGNVLWMVMKEVVWMAALGVAFAWPLALGLGRLVKSVLYDVTANDPFTLVAATTVLSVVALAAGLVPALRASRISPTQALRHE
ncbi:MAG TPA: FtsX-like permease family protein, partial [Alphaproteobacteria bacterium]|nr:FtsX-like permease family protein [Alphaproteobacteria bacterium]